MSDPIIRLNAALDGRYRIERLLGEGGMAMVYLADDLRHERRVALKVLKPELSAIVGGERFLAEIRTTAHLQHPHIVPLFDSGEADGLLFYVMPHVEGESLRQRLDRTHQLPVDESVRIARDVADALQAAHEEGIVHRDIKPSNILLSRGRPLVTDFGIALALSSAGDGRLTETGLSLGTPHYMSPEQATGDLDAGPATDIYALGCVLYEMLAGTPPHVGSTAQAVLVQIIAGEVGPVTKHRKSVPDNVEAAISKALEKVPADRFGSARQFAGALADERFRYGGQIAGTGRGRAGWVLAALVIGLLAGGTASALLDRGETTEAVLFRETPPNGTRFLEPPLPSPDGRTLAMLVEDSSSERKMWVRSLDGEDARVLDGTEGASVMFWSPDSEELVFHVSGELRRIRLDGSRNRLIASLGIRAGVWTPDGQLVVSSVDHGIVTMPPTGGTPGTLVEGAQFRDLDLVRAGPHLLYGQFGGETGIHTVNLSNGEHELLVPGVGGRARYVAPDLFVYVKDRVLLAQRFRPSDMGLVGDPFPLARDVGDQSFAGSAAGVVTFIRGRNDMQRLVWLDREGQVIGEAAPDGHYTEVYLSPGGNRMMFTRSDPATGNRDLWVSSPERDARPNRFTIDSDVDHLAAFSPDGEEIAWEGHTGGELNLVRRPADGSAPASIVRTWGRAGGPDDWSPDGGFVLYRSDDGPTGWNLWAVPMEGDGEPFPLVESAFDHTYGKFSPDGGWLAYTSNASGRSEVYLQRLDSMRLVGGAQRVSDGGGSQPQWRSDGTELFFVSGGSLMAVETRLDQDFPAATPRILFESGELASRNGYDVTPDGQRFLAIVTETRGRSGSATVVLDWAAGLEGN